MGKAKKNEKKNQQVTQGKNLKNPQSKQKVIKPKVASKTRKTKKKTLEIIKEVDTKSKMTVQLMKREAELNNAKTIPLSHDSKTWLMFGTQITKNLCDHEFVIRVIINGGNYVEFDWDSYDKLFNIPRDYNNCVQQKVQRTIVKSEKLQVDVYSKNHKSWFLLFTDDNGSSISLAESEVLVLLNHKAQISNDWMDYKVKKQETIKKFDLLQNIIAFMLNDKKVNSTMNLIQLKNMPKKEFNSLVQMVEDLWSKIHKVK